MAYNSIQYAAFFMVVFVLYYLVPKKAQWWLLLLSSVVFFWICSGNLILWVLLTALAVWAGALQLEKITAAGNEEIKAGKGILSKEDKTRIKEKVKRKKKAVLSLALLFAVGILLVLKYANFFGHNLNAVLHVLGKGDLVPTFSWIQPLGISFYTLQAVGYLLDVYYNRYAAEKNPVKILTFLLYFPHIVEGPISKYNELSGPLFASHRADYRQITFGFQRMLWGCLKKMVIADRAAILVNEVYGSYTEYSGVTVVAATLLYVLQIYTEFSGCMDIVCGSSQVFGIPLVENFERPFFSRSVAEFWRRWHISLGRWLREYVFYPLNLSKTLTRWGKKFRTCMPNQFGKCLSLYIAMLILWFVTGFWHGASWRYVAYGVYYGMLIILGIQLEPVFQKMIPFFSIDTKRFSWRLWQMLRTFFVVFWGMMLFRAESLKAACKMAVSVFRSFQIWKLFDYSLLNLGLGWEDFCILGIGTLVLFGVSLCQEKGYHIRETLAAQALWFRWLVYLTAIFVLLVYGAYGYGYDAIAFIYGQF